jgi:hypothetical protein
MGAKELYDVDFFEWTQQNAELLRRGCLDAADIEHIAEELEDMGKSNRREVRSFLRRLIMHLLKWQVQPTFHCASWQSSIKDSRVQLKDLFADSPSLKRIAAQSIAEIYPDAVGLASTETGLDLNRFPPECPYTFDQLLDPDYLPDG